MLPVPRGFSDLPLDTDLTAEGLGIANYYRGLAKFITACRTPMTIAIQGDWGTGKTSAMNFVRHELPANVKTIEFNTWQYAQLHLDDELVFSLMKAVSRPLAGESSKARAYLRSVGRISSVVLRSATKLAATSVGMGNVAGDTLDAVEQELLGEPVDLVERIAQLRGDFQSAVEQYCRETSTERVVVFIDDLDRLEPRQAVEIMEALKLFFECPKCVFVLAIDFEVVAAGVADKYGSDLTERKARSFFDKIIQVPFQMPVTAYRVTELLARELNERADLRISNDAIGSLVHAAALSIGNNPRSLKRLLNTFDLLHLIAEETRQGDSFDEQHSLALFHLLCAQAAFPRFHAALSAAASDPDALLRILNFESENEDDAVGPATYALEPREWMTLQAFAKEFQSTILGEPSDGESVPESIHIVQESLRLAEVTSTGTSQKTTVTETSDLVWNDTDRLQQAGGLTNDRMTWRLSLLEERLRQRLDERPLVVAAQQNGTWSLYRSGSAAEVASLRTRARPKFAEISFGQQWMTIRFGELSRDLEGPAYKARWNAVVTSLESALALHPDASAKLGFTRTNNPINVSHIESETDIDIAVEALVQVYDLTATR